MEEPPQKTRPFLDIIVIKGINVYHFAEARAYEIKNLQQALKHATQNSLPQQRLPRHMRRRAASHDIRRIPKRVRPLAKEEVSLIPICEN